MTLPSAPVRIIAVAVLCVLALVGLVVREGMARAAGAEVTLPMDTVDPRSLLSGHYVTIDLREAVPPDLPCPPDNPEARWIGLSPNGRTAATGARLYSMTSSAPTRDDANLIPESVMVKGAFTCNPPTPAQGDAPGIPGALWLNLGVSRFYVSQADAERIGRVLMEQRNGETRVFAVLSVGGDGQARVKALIVDNERFELGWL